MLQEQTGIAVVLTFDRYNRRFECYNPTWRSRRLVYSRRKFSPTDLEYPYLQPQIALNYYLHWLTSSVGTYPAPIWHDLWALHNKPVFRHYHNMSYTLPRVLQSLKANCADVLFKPEFLQVQKSAAIGKEVRIVKPVVQYPGGVVELKFNVGTRGNEVDGAWWPGDLMAEIVV